MTSEDIETLWYYTSFAYFFLGWLCEYSKKPGHSENDSSYWLLPHKRSPSYSWSEYIIGNCLMFKSQQNTEVIFIHTGTGETEEKEKTTSEAVWCWFCQVTMETHILGNTVKPRLHWYKASTLTGTPPVLPIKMNSIFSWNDHRHHHYYYLAFRSIGGELTQDGDFILFENNRYRGGYLYKTLAMSAVVSTGADLIYGGLQLGKVWGKWLFLVMIGDGRH